MIFSHFIHQLQGLQKRKVLNSILPCNWEKLISPGKQQWTAINDVLCEGHKKTDGHNNRFHDNLDGNFGNFDDNDVKNYRNVNKRLLFLETITR